MLVYQAFSEPLLWVDNMVGAKCVETNKSTSGLKKQGAEKE